MSESDALAHMAELHDRELDARADPPARVKAKQVHAPRIHEPIRREVVRLHDKGDSYKRIAAATGIHKSTVQRIVERARSEE
jgi:DNA invertase Pin-like site-specific DNA recombinase